MINATNGLKRYASFFAATSSLLLLGVVVAAFWFQDWQYSLPTPKPAGLTQPSAGATVPVPTEFVTTFGNHKGPLLLHFYSADCPCSEFNLEHLAGLQRQFQGKARVVVVVQSNDLEAARRRLAARGVTAESVADPKGELAKRFGVFTTPQAVVLNAEGRLAYRGNYNASRYCRDRNSEFARIALEATVQGRPAPKFPEAAYLAYGCLTPSFRQSGR